LGETEGVKSLSLIRQIKKRFGSPIFTLTHLIKGDMDIQRAERLLKYGYLWKWEYELFTRKTRKKDAK